MQTFLQTFSSDIISKSEIIIQNGFVNDYPLYNWRGMHLDVSRHFFSVKDVKKYIDILAMHKLNIFHWHLTDDHGWRIEIKKYPKLTEIGAFRKDRRSDKWGLADNQRKPYDDNKAFYGGFYTQDEIKEVVEYALERQITIIPEIEMPGHSRAALVAYPEYSCFQYDKELPTGGYVGDNWDFSDPFCAGKDSTFFFLQDILDEVIELFPSEYIHIGGDECSKNRWTQCPKCQDRIKNEGLKDEFELQSYFIQRIEKYINSKGRKIIGWQEILEGGINPSATIMPWKGTTALEVCVEAAKEGHDIVMSPSTYMYFNREWPNGDFVEGKALEENKFHKAIIGVEACAWSEHTQTFKDVEYQTMPRIAALAEVGWTAHKNFDDFSSKLEILKAKYKKLDINYYIPFPTGLDDRTVFTDKANIELEVSQQNLIIRYTTNGSDPIKSSTEYKGIFTIDKTTTLKIATFDKYGQRSLVKTGMLVKQNFKKPDTLKQPKKGVKYSIIYDKFISAEQVGGITEKEGILDEIKLPKYKQGKELGFVFDGFINIPEKSIYTFGLSSRDGSILEIGDEIVVDHDGFHNDYVTVINAKGEKEKKIFFKKGEIALDKGLHQFKIRYFNWGNNPSIKLVIESPNLEKQEIKQSMLFN